MPLLCGLLLVEPIHYCYYSGICVFIMRHGRYYYTHIAKIILS